MKKADLNLLVIFDAIMREGSMTRAAEQLAMTQPAVSNAVSRMRVAWNDPLFVKDGRGIAPTPRAQVLWAEARPHLDDLREMTNPEPFDAANARRTFRIGTDDLSAGLLWRALRRVTEQSAPNIDFHAIPNSKTNTEQLLVNAEADLVVSARAKTPGSHIREQTLLDSYFVCVMRIDHPLASEPLLLESFVAADHLMVSLKGNTAGPVDKILQARGLDRRIAMTVNHFSLVAQLLKESDLIGTVPFEAVAEDVCREELRVLAPPVEIPPNRVTMRWHERSDRDAGHHWLRDQIETIAQDTRRALPIPDCVRPRRQSSDGEQAHDAVGGGSHPA